MKLTVKDFDHCLLKLEEANSPDFGDYRQTILDFGIIHKLI